MLLIRIVRNRSLKIQVRWAAIAAFLAFMGSLRFPFSRSAEKKRCRSRTECDRRRRGGEKPSEPCERGS